jgi:hypothetical protein
VLEGLAHIHRDDRCHITVSEIGKELADHEQQKEEPTQAGECLSDGVDAVDHAR